MPGFFSSANRRLNQTACGRDKAVADPYLVGQLTTEKLIDQTRDCRFIAEEPAERARFKYERSRIVLGNHRRGGRLFRQESDFTNEVAPFQMRDLTARDRHSDAAIANEIKPLECLILFGQRRAPSDIAQLAGEQEPRNLCIVEAGEDIAQQVAIGLGQAKR